MVTLLKQKIFQLIKKNLLDFIRIIISLPIYIIDSLIISGHNEYTGKKLLVIKIDELGDYTLFRNFLKIIRNSKKYHDYEITIIGNIKWKELSEHFDSANYNNAIWLDNRKFTTSFKYRKGILSQINCRKFDLVLNPASSRNFIIDDSIVRAAKAINSIGFLTDSANSPRLLTVISNSFYTELFNLPKKCYFEFYRNHFFFEKVLQENISIKKPSFTINDKGLIPTEQRKFVIIAPGAGMDYRRWPINQFAVVCKYINKEYQYDIKLIGGNSEYLLASQLIRLSQVDNIKDLTGKTSQIDLVNIIKNAELLISNDTGTSHIAGALEKKTLIISNGSRFGRFTPYPKDLGLEVFTIYPPAIMKQFDKNYDLLERLFKFKSYINISSISVGTVIDKINFLLSK